MITPQPSYTFSIFLQLLLLHLLSPYLRYFFLLLSPPTLPLLSMESPRSQCSIIIRTSQGIPSLFFFPSIPPSNIKHFFFSHDVQAYTVRYLFRSTATHTITTNIRGRILCRELKGYLLFLQTMPQIILY